MRMVYKIAALILVTAIILTFSACSSDTGVSPVVDSLSINAGDAAPSVSDYLVDGYEGEFVTDPSPDAGTVGIYEAVIKVDDKEYTTYLIVTDSVPPTGEVQNLQIKPGTEIKAEDFFVSMEDASGVTAEFVGEAPDTSKPGVHDVKLCLVDSALNQSDYSARLIVSELDPVTVEARLEPLTVSEFTDDPGAEFSDSEYFIPSTVGEFEIGVKLDGVENITVLTVEDTTEPQGTPVDLNWFTEHPVEPEKLVENAFDFSEITYSYAEEPDWTNENTQAVTVMMTDSCGNSNSVISTITLTPDVEPPQIYGLEDHMYFYQNGTISYLGSVYVTDNCDSEEDITLEVDKSAVDIYTLGEYPVIYTATDTSGNVTTKEIVVEMVEQTITQEQLDEEIQKTLDLITTDDMTMGQKAFEIYKYVRGKIVYTGDSNKEDYIGEAYRGLTEFKGDCFTFYSTTDCLLKAIGAETMRVDRMYNSTRPTHHYWVKCNLGTGWYHIDTTNTGPKNFEAFMRTDDDFLKRAPTYWLFDRSLYPASPTTPYVKDWEESASE